MPAIGTKLQVWRGMADHTSGGLVKKDLMLNKHGRIVSKKKHAIGLKMYRKNKDMMAEPFKKNDKRIYKNKVKKSRSRSRSKSKK